MDRGPVLGIWIEMPLGSGHGKHVKGILRPFYAPEQDRSVISSDGYGPFDLQDVHVLGELIRGVCRELFSKSVIDDGSELFLLPRPVDGESDG
jgi:hypothetical protein